MSEKITIAGGGIAGLAIAIALEQEGLRSLIFEGADSANEAAAGAGLGLAPNAMAAFRKLGLYDQVMEAGQVLPAVSIYSDSGKLLRRKKFDGGNIGIIRADLHSLLLSHIDKDSYITGKSIKEIKQANGDIDIQFGDGTRHRSAFLIAADGIRSVVRSFLLSADPVRYAGYTSWRGIAENLPSSVRDASETLGPAGRFGIVPLRDNKAYWFAAINAPEKDRGISAGMLPAIFKDYPGHVSEALEHTAIPPIRTDVSDLRPLRKFAYGNILLAGDAAHAATPNLAQGASQALEDAVVLADAIRAAGSCGNAFVLFQEKRRARVNRIIRQSGSIGKIMQFENPLLCGIRNLALQYIPANIMERRFEKLHKTDF